ncbi:hypothetical protein L3B09_09900, partial [Streptococcus pneumoniae]|nr:hypothetical protein [Streptococcus pneumoniae]MDV8552311.1 hypothetical protein [Streptococcus pneumoniae]
RNHPGSKLRQGFWMVFRFGVNNWGLQNILILEVKSIFNNVLEITVGYSIFNYPYSIAIIVFLDYKKTTFC